MELSCATIIIQALIQEQKRPGINFLWIKEDLLFSYEVPMGSAFIIK